MNRFQNERRKGGRVPEDDKGERRVDKRDNKGDRGITKEVV